MEDDTRGAVAEDLSGGLSTDSSGGLVTVVIDLNEAVWASVSSRHASALALDPASSKSSALPDGTTASSSPEAISLQSALSCVSVFLNAVLLMDRESEVCVVAECPDGSAHVLCRGETDVGPALESGLRSVSSSASTPRSSQSSGLSAALSVALSSTNRAMVDHRSRFGVDPKARILLVQVTPDDPSQYIASMNTAFAAQKLGVLIDVVDLSPEPSKILQQVSHLSRGITQRFEALTAPALTEHLLTVYLPDADTRKLLRLPPQAAIILQAACFCCGKLRDRGWVCSVCLSVWCKDPRLKSFRAELIPGVQGSQSTCPTCHTRINKPVNMES